MIRALKWITKNLDPKRDWIVNVVAWAICTAGYTKVASLLIEKDLIPSQHALPVLGFYGLLLIALALCLLATGKI